MADLAHYDHLHEGFSRLLKDLLPGWPMEDDIKYVLEYLDHNEYGEALENLIAVGLHNGVGFRLDQIQQVEILAAAMRMEDSPLLAQLRDAGRQNAYASALCDQAAVNFRPGWLDGLKQVALTFALTFVTLALVMAVSAVASALLGTAVNGSPPVRPIATGSSTSIASQIVSSSMFFLLLAALIWGPVRRWWQMRREMASLSS